TWPAGSSPTSTTASPGVRPSRAARSETAALIRSRRAAAKAFPSISFSACLLRFMNISRYTSGFSTSCCPFLLRPAGMRRLWLPARRRGTSRLLWVKLLKALAQRLPIPVEQEGLVTRLLPRDQLQVALRQLPALGEQCYQRGIGLAVFRRGSHPDLEHQAPICQAFQPLYGGTAGARLQAYVHLQPLGNDTPGGHQIRAGRMS